MYNSALINTKVDINLILTHASSSPVHSRYDACSITQYLLDCLTAFIQAMSANGYKTAYNQLLHVAAILKFLRLYLPNLSDNAKVHWKKNMYFRFVFMFIMCRYVSCYFYNVIFMLEYARLCELSCSLCAVMLHTR